MTLETPGNVPPIGAQDLDNLDGAQLAERTERRPAQQLLVLFILGSQCLGSFRVLTAKFPECNHFPTVQRRLYPHLTKIAEVRGPRGR